MDKLDYILPIILDFGIAIYIILFFIGKRKFNKSKPYTLFLLILTILLLILVIILTISNFNWMKLISVAFIAGLVWVNFDMYKELKGEGH